MATLDNTSKVSTSRMNGIMELIDEQDSNTVHLDDDQTIGGQKNFTTTPTVPTIQDKLDRSNNVATTEFVQNVLDRKLDMFAIDEEVVHRSGDEEISGNKTFKNNILMTSEYFDKGLIIRDEGIDYSTIPSEDWRNRAFRCVDKNFKILGDIRFVRSNTGTQSTLLYARNNLTGSEINGILSVSVDKNGTSFTSAPTPTDGTSTTSKQIATVGWVNTKLGSYPLDTNVVHKTGDETISGKKTFNAETTHKVGNGNGQIRLYADSASTILRNDGSNTYILLTNKDDASGSWNSLRPLTINNTTGIVTTTTPTDNTTTSKQIDTVGARNSKLANYVDLSSAQTITGVKTFTSTINGTAMQAYWADLAEKYKSDYNYSEGTLVQFGGEKEITIATTEANAVVSSKPGLILNKNERGTLIALSGQTPVKVIGKVNKFDKLVLSEIPGVARKKKWYEIWKPTIAITLESNTKNDEKLVNCVTKLTF